MSLGLTRRLSDGMRFRVCSRAFDHVGFVYSACMLMGSFGCALVMFACKGTCFEDGSLDKDRFHHRALGRLGGKRRGGSGHVLESETRVCLHQGV